MSTSESHFDEPPYWQDKPDAGYYDPLNDDMEGSPESLPEYGTTALPIMGAFMLYIVYWYLQGGYRFPALGSIRFEFLLGGALSAISVIKILQNKDNVFPGVVKWAIAFVILMGIMTFITVDPQLSETIMRDRVLKFLMMGVFIYAFVCSPLTLRFFLFAWLFAFAKMAQEGMIGWLGGSLVWENQGTMRLHGSTPNYRHPNSFSGTQLATLPFLYFLFPLAPRLLQIAMAGQIIGALIVVMTTGSRTGYVALAAGLLLLIWKSNSKLKALAVCCLITVVAAPYIPQDYIERAETIFTQQDEEGGSINARRQILEDAVQISNENILGVGLGAFPSERKKRFNRAQDTHNLYLEVLTELGIQGLFLFLALMMSLLGLLFKLVRRTRWELQQLEKIKQDTEDLLQHRNDLKLVLATTYGLTGFLVIRLTVGLFGHDLFEIYWWFSIGLAVALAHIMRTAGKRTEWFMQTMPLEHEPEEQDEYSSWSPPRPPEFN